MSSARSEIRSDLIRRVLKRVPLFAGLGAGELAALARQCDLRAYEKAQMVYAEGEAARSAYVIMYGQIDSIWYDKTGREVIFETRTRYDLLGLHEVADGRGRPATCVCASRAALVHIPPGASRRLLDHPGVQAALARNARDELRNLRDSYRRAVLFDLETRLAHYLLAQADPGRGRPHQLRIEENQLRIAAKVQASRTRVNTTIRKWRESGDIAVKDGAILLERTSRLWDRFGPDQS